LAQHSKWELQRMSFPAVDYTQYATWERVVAPNGAVYYRVPGSGYLLDPFLSSTRGRPVLFADPSPQVKEKEDAESERKKLIKQQEDASSPLGQLAPVAGSVAGAVATKYATDALFPAAVDPVKQAAADLIRSQIPKIVTNQVTQGAAQLATPIAAEAGSAAAAAPELTSMLGYGNYVGPSAAATPAAAGGGFFESVAASAPYTMMAAPLAFIGMANMNRQRTKMAEEKKVAKLSRAGVELPDNILKFEKEFREDLPEDFVGYDANGVFVNNKFAQSRNESDLAADDFLTRGALYEMFEGDSAAMRQLAEVAAAKGLAREAKGQIQTILTPELEAQAEALGLKLRGSRGDYRIALGNPNDDMILGGLQEADRQGDAFQRTNPFSDNFDPNNQTMKFLGGAFLDLKAKRGAGRRVDIGEQFRKEYEQRKQDALQALGGFSVEPPPSATTPPPQVMAAPADLEEEPMQKQTPQSAFLQGAMSGQPNVLAPDGYNKMDPVTGAQTMMHRYAPGQAPPDFLGLLAQQPGAQLNSSNPGLTSWTGPMPSGVPPQQSVPKPMPLPTEPAKVMTPEEEKRQRIAMALAGRMNSRGV